MKFCSKQAIVSLLTGFLILPFNSHGKKNGEIDSNRKGVNEIEISFTPQYYFNGLNVHNDGVIPDLITSKNRPGFNIGLDYNRVTRYGLVYGAGISFGQIGHDVTVNYKNHNFFYPGNDYPAMTEELAKHSTHYHYLGNLYYLSIHPSLGYRFKLPDEIMKGWDFQIDLTCDFLHYLNGSFNSLSLQSDFLNKAGDSLFLNVPVLGYDAEFGKSANESFWEEQVFVMYGADINLSKEINWRWVSNVSIGLKFTYAGNGRNSTDGSYYNSQTSGSGYINARAYNYKSVYYKNPDPVSSDEYRARDFSIGIKLAVGLWPNVTKQKNQ